MYRLLDLLSTVCICIGSSSSSVQHSLCIDCRFLERREIRVEALTVTLIDFLSDDDENEMREKET